MAIAAPAMRVCLIAYHFPPDPAVGSLRALNVARAFRDAGHSVHVISVQSPSIGTAWKERGIEVERVRALPMARELYAGLKTWFTSRHRPSAAVEVKEVEGWSPPTRVAAWRRLLNSLIWLPDDRQGFIWPAYAAVRSLGLSSSDLVYSTCPPYSPHLSGLLAKMNLGVRWAIEFRDPWTRSRQKPWWIRSGLADRLDAWLERMCLRHADYVVSVSEGIHRGLLSGLSRAERAKCVLVRNGIERLAPAATTERVHSGPRHILHLGTFSHGRDPRPFLRALAVLAKREELGPDRIQVEFVGQCRWFGPHSLEQLVEQLGIARLVQFQDWVPREKAAELLGAADAVLLLAQDQPDQVPNKLYEYLGTRKPIIAYADADGESARMLREVGGHHLIVGDDAERAADVLGEVILASRDEPHGASRANALLLEWTTERQMHRLMETLGAMS